MSVCQSETEKHAGLTIIWYCQPEWVKILKKIWVILMFLDWQNVQWTANDMLIIRTGNTSKVFNMTVYVSVIIFTITITVLTTAGWLWVEGLWSPPNSKLASILRSWNRSFGCNALIFTTHAPLFRGGGDHVCESPLGDSCFVMNIHNYNCQGHQL